MKSGSSSGGGPLNPRTSKYEWMGPVGAGVMVLSLPVLVLGLTALCTADSCTVYNIFRLHELIMAEVRLSLPNLLWIMGVEVTWLLVHCSLYLQNIGSVVDGVQLRNNARLLYTINAIHVFYACHAAVALGHFAGFFNLGDLVSHIFTFALGACLLSLVFSVVLYVASFRPGTLLALGGNSGNMIYDFWVGRELNPRIGYLDFKFVCELRPGLIGWSIINWAYVARAVQEGTCGPAIVLVAIFESWYVLEGLLFEAGNLTMMDIVQDGFGYMLCFGDLAWVPFVYTIKTRFIYFYPQFHSPIYLSFCTAMMLFGYYLFRGSNSEKDRFRKNPLDERVAHLKVMRTSAGRSLIISGFWGVCRHPNYVGDWLMTNSWCLLTGTVFALPYFHSIYFAFLLIHRQLRDEGEMLHKYGAEDWNRFCSIVRYRLIPYLY